MQNWINDLYNVLIFFYVFDLIIIIKILWIIIIIKIFANLYFHFFKLIFIDLLKYLKIYSFLYHRVSLVLKNNENKFIFNFLFYLKTKMEKKSYIHLVFYLFDYFIWFLFYMIFVFWLDFIWFLLYDFRWWWRKSIKTNLKVYAKDEIDPELSRIFYVHHGIHFINRLKFITFIRFIYFSVYVLYAFIICKIKIFFLSIFKNYYYYFSIIFFSYKLNWSNKSFMFFWNFYIILRNASYFLRNSYVGFLLLNWYRKYTEKGLETSWVERLADPHLINQKSLIYHLFDVLLPWSIYKQQVKYGKINNNLLVLLVYILNFSLLILINYLPFNKIKNIKTFQKWNVFKIRLIKYLLTYLNLNLFSILITWISLVLFCICKFILFSLQLIKNISASTFKIFDFCFVYFELFIFKILLFVRDVLAILISFIINLLKFIYLYRLFIIILLLLCLINLKYIFAIIFYILDWFLQYYILDWFFISEHIFSMDPAHQVDYIRTRVNNSRFGPLDVEHVMHNRFKAYYKHSWWYLALHCLTTIERWVEWQMSRFWTLKVFLNQERLYYYHIFCTIFSYRVFFVLSCIEYLFIDHIVLYMIDSLDFFIYITKLDVLFSYSLPYFTLIITKLDYYFFSFFKTTGNQIQRVYSVFSLVLLNVWGFIENIFVNLLVGDFKLIYWYIKSLIKAFWLTLQEVLIHNIYYIKMLFIKLLNIIDLLRKRSKAILVPLFRSIVEIPIGKHLFTYILFKIQDFIFQYKLSIDAWLFDIENIEQRTMKEFALKEKKYEIIPKCVDGKSFYFTKEVRLYVNYKTKRNIVRKIVAAWKFLKMRERFKLCYHKPLIKLPIILRTDPLELFAWRHPEMGVYFFISRGIYTNWYNYHESFPMFERISHIIDNAKTKERAELIRLMDKSVTSSIKEFGIFRRDIQYTLGNYNLWRPSYEAYKETSAIMPEYFNHVFEKRWLDRRMKIFKNMYFDYEFKTKREKERNYLYLYPRLFYFFPKNILGYVYPHNPENKFDFRLGADYQHFFQTRVLTFESLTLKHWSKFYVHREYFLLNDFLLWVLDARHTLHNLHFLILAFFPLFFLFVFLFPGFKLLCFNSFDDYGDVRYWWNRFREKSLDEIPWVTETLSKEVFSFIDDHTQMLLKKGRDLIKEQSTEYFNKTPLQIAKWTLLKKHNLLDKHTYFKDFVLGRNFALFHVSKTYENFWDIRFKSLKDASNFELLLAYGFSRDNVIKNLVLNDFVDFEELFLDKDYEIFKKYSDKFIKLCFNLDRDLFNFTLPGSLYHRDIQTLSYIKSPEGIYLMSENLPYSMFNLEYWLFSLLMFFLAIYSFRLGLHDSRLALNEYSYILGALFGHSDISFYWNSYFFGMHWFHWNYYNVEQGFPHNDFKKLMISPSHAINALYFGPFSITNDFTLIPLNISIFRINTISIPVLIFFSINFFAFIFSLYYFKIMKIKLETNKSLEINKNLFDLMTQTEYSIEYLIIYFNNLLGYNSYNGYVKKVNNNLRKENENLKIKVFDSFLSKIKIKKSILNTFKDLLK